MGRTFVQNLAFDELSAYEISRETFSPAGPIEDALLAFAPKLIAMGGLALFGSALVVAFRIIALDAVHQLRQPAIDFAICGAIAFLGLCISWIHLGDNRQAEAEDMIEDNIEFAVEPMLPASTLPAAASPEPAYSSAPPAKARAGHAARRSSLLQRWMDAHACRFCGQKMVSLGLALYHCHGCRHLEHVGPVSFLDPASSCTCQYCCHNLRHAG